MIDKKGTILDNPRWAEYMFVYDIAVCCFRVGAGGAHAVDCGYECQQHSGAGEAVVIGRAHGMRMYARTLPSHPPADPLPTPPAPPQVHTAAVAEEPAGRGAAAQGPHSGDVWNDSPQVPGHQRRGQPARGELAALLSWQVGGAGLGAVGVWLKRVCGVFAAGRAGVEQEGGHGCSCVLSRRYARSPPGFEG